MKSFLEIYPKLNVNFQVDQYNGTPLHIAVCMGKLKIVKFLLKIGAQIDVLNKEGKTPIDIAKDSNRKDIARILQSLISYEEVYVHGEGDCLFWFVALAYLTPVKFDDYAFRERFRKLFTSDYDAHSIQRLMQGNTNIYEDNTMRQLVTKIFRGEVANEMCFSQRRLENKIDIMDFFFESCSGSYFTKVSLKESFNMNSMLEKLSRIMLILVNSNPNFLMKMQ
ncbi:MAG: ankyrin repeat domain-containing protein [Wolbachia sp.]